jgi:hypothetical protein
MSGLAEVRAGLAAVSSCDWNMKPKEAKKTVEAGHTMVVPPKTISK